MDLFDLFSPTVAAWFRATFSAPTPPQAQGWPVIAGGEHALIISPTGSGKTLTAFLWSLDALFRDLVANPEPPKGARTRGSYQPGIRVVYVSPLKALNNDVERNLQVPLAGIRAIARDLGEPLPELRVAVRTGDTPAAERQKMLARPPHILITTPESLYLMLTSDRARSLFATTHTVIVDEIHTLVGTKRGAHLALSLERLECQTQRRLQRIGLSATVRPLETAARFLGGQDPRADHAERPVRVVDATYDKKIDLRVVTVVEDFRDLPGDSVWATIVPRVARLIDEHRTTLIFCNSRRLAERTADRLNEFRLRERSGSDATPSPSRRAGSGDLGMFAAGIDAKMLESVGLQPIRAHHGSMSKVARLEMEAALKSGRLPALVCTSSLELGIDIGEVDLVVHLQSPKSVSSGLQRVGRSGHLVGQTSVGWIFPTFVEDVIEAAAVSRGMLRREIEHVETPENPLDILAQQIVAMVGVEDWSAADTLAVVRGAYPFRNLSEPAFRNVLDMLAGKYPESVSRSLKPLVSWDRVNDRLTALPATRLLATGSGGTIPDRGTYSLVLSDRRTKVGDLDEEFVFETRPGDTFLLGSHVWRVSEIADDRVIAEPAPGEIPRMPFWRGDAPWRPYDLGRRIGSFRREVADLVRELSEDELDWVLGMTDGGEGTERRETVAVRRLLTFLGNECALDRNSIVQVVGYVARQLDAIGQFASDRSILVETFRDALGEPRLVIHSSFGGRVNGPWSIVLAGAIRERLGVETQVISGDDGILLRFLNADLDPPVDLVKGLTGREARERILAELPNSATFVAQFRMNAARALLLPRERAGKRTPLWLSRLRAKDLLQAVQQFGDFPILLETYRDCLRDVMDLDGLLDVLDRIERGEISVVVHDADVPSPVARGLDYRFAMQYVYEYDQPRGERQLSALNLDRDLLADLLRDGTLAALLRPEAVAEVASRAAKIGVNDRCRDPEELAQLLYEFGDLSEAEIQARARGGAASWISGLLTAGRAYWWTFGEARRLIHAERFAEYAALEASPDPVLRRYLAHAGPTTTAELAARYGLSPARIDEALAGAPRDVAFGRFEPGTGDQWIDRRNLEQMHRRTLGILRKEVRPVPLATYAAFLARWQHVGADLQLRTSQPADGEDGDEAGERGTSLTRTLQQLRGLAIPGVIWERDVLPLRVPAFDPSDLAERCQSGELMWVAEGGRDPRRARVQLLFRGDGTLFLERNPSEDVLAGLTEGARSAYDYLAGEGAALLADIAEGAGLGQSETREALVELALAGLVTNDSYDALRNILGYEPPRPARDRTRSSLEAQLAALRPGHSQAGPLSRQRLRDARRRAHEAVLVATRARRMPWVGRWSLVRRPSLLGKPLPVEERDLRQARQLLTRWGIVTRACLERESPLFDWDRLFALLSRLESQGAVRRGYFVEGLPGIQFAVPDAVEQLRAVGRDIQSGWDPSEGIVVLNAADPAQLFGSDSFGGGLRFSRVASTAVAAWRGEPVAILEDSGASAAAVEEHPAAIPSLRALAGWWKSRIDGRLRVERWRGEPVQTSAGAYLLEAAGFVREFGGMLWNG